MRIPKTKLPQITAKTVKDAVKWLKSNDCGCFHFHIADMDEGLMHICIGWHDYGDNWAIAWKIGMESYSNAMQCDLDVDFYMPYDKDGNVYDTLTEIGDSAVDFAAIAREMNKCAKDVWNFQKCKEMQEAA